MCDVLADDVRHIISLGLSHKQDRTMKIVVSLLLLLDTVGAFSANSPAFLKSHASSTQLFGEFGASSTSFYTKTEKKDSYESLDKVLEEKCSDIKVRQVIKDMLDVCAEITEALRTALVTVEGSMNDFGDAQLSVDVSYDQTSFITLVSFEKF